MSEFVIDFSKIKTLGGQLPALTYYNSMELQSHRHFLENIWDQVNRDQQELKNQIKSDVENGLVDPANSFSYYEDEYHLLDSMPTIHLHSQLLILFSYFESTCRKFCDETAADLQLSETIDTTEGSSLLEKVKNHITRELELPFATLNDCWRSITDYQKIRNLIAHRNANVIEKPVLPLAEQAHYQLVKRLSDHLLLSSLGYLKIRSPQYLVEFCTLQQKFFDDLANLINKIHYDDKDWS